MKRYQMVVTGLSAVLAVLVLTFVVLLLMVVGTFGTSTLATQSPNLQPTASPTPVPLAITPQQGWVAAKTGLLFPLAVSFSGNNPYIGYACGVTKTSGSDAVLQFSKTTNGGVSWQPLAASSLKYPSCAVKVSPSDPQAVLLAAQPCLVVCYGGQETKYYVSHDGTQTWQALQIPNGENTTVQLVEMHWIGKGLLGRVQHFSQQVDNQRPIYQVVYSSDGLTLNWLDEPAFYAILGRTMRVVDVAAFGAILQVRLQLYSQYATCQSQTPNCTDVMQTSDGGGTWDHFTATGKEPAVNAAIVAAPDGKTLYSTSNDGAHVVVVTSTDDGHTWAALDPALSLPTTNVLSLTRAPDGTLFANAIVQQNGGTASRKLYRLSKGTGAWQPILSEATGNDLADISINLSGHPVALWEITITTTNAPGNVTAATLAYHAPTT